MLPTQLIRELAFFVSPLFLPLVATASPLGLGGADGDCTMEEEAAGLCFEYPGGFVVEAITGPAGEFPVLTPEGNSEFRYLVTGLGAGGCHDVSHTDIQIPVCDDPLVILEAGPAAELKTGGHGDPSCGFGTGDLEHDVLKWDIGVPCNGSLELTLVIEGIVEAELQDFLIKAATDCYVAQILGPSCDSTPPPGTGEPYCFGNGCPCGNDDPNAGCAYSTGAGGLLLGTGSTSVSRNNLTMSATNLIPAQTALLYSGALTLNGGNGRSFGDGLRCVGTQVQRLHVGLADAGGSFVCGPGVIGLETNPMAGDLRRMQVWYRDPMGGPCGSGFNLTNGVELIYTP